LDAETLGAFEEFPDDLWLESKSHADRATSPFLKRRHNHQSLYLVGPIDLRIELSYEHNQYKNKDQKRTRARFFYRGQEYQMNLTDPEFTTRFCTMYPALGARALVVRPPYKDDCLICVSLTPEFNGYHYKVVAAIMEML